MLENEGATAEVDEVQSTEVVDAPVEKSMDDTIRETLQGLKSRGMEAEGDKEAESSEEKAQRIRDEAGRFKAPDTPAEPPVDPPAVPEVPVEAVAPAPNTWKKEVAAKWATLAPDVQAEVVRREADFHKGIEGYKAKAQFADSVANVLQPYSQTLKHLEQTQGISAEKALDALLSADHKLRYGSPVEKQMYFHQLAQSYGIDLANAQEIPQADQQVFTLQQRLSQLETALQNQTQQGAQREQQELNSTIAAFAADPKHSHFESVKGHMSALLQAGQAKDLADAYEQAVYANPTTRAAMLQQQMDAQREEAAKKAKAAKEAASINVPRRPSMPVTQPIGTMDETIRATLRRLQGA